MAKMGRPHKAVTKNLQIGIRLTEETAEKLKNCADTLRISRTAVIEKGIDKVYKSIKRK